MMPPANAPVSALARETGITEQTLYVWRREAKGKGLAVPGDGKNAEGWSSEDKFAVVLETAPLNAAELAEYCRRKGLCIPSKLRRGGPHVSPPTRMPPSRRASNV
jgi:transposase